MMNIGLRKIGWLNESLKGEGFRIQWWVRLIRRVGNRMAGRSNNTIPLIRNSGGLGRNFGRDKREWRRILAEKGYY